MHPFALRRRGGEHAPNLARELLGRGHFVRGFGAPPGRIPRSGPDFPVEGEAAPGDGLGLAGFRPDVIVAYDALSPAAWLGARRARRLTLPLVLVEEGLPEAGSSFERFLRQSGEHLFGAYVRRAATRVVAVDGVARAQALKEGFRPSQVELVPRGVDLANYRPGLTSSLPARHGVRGRIVLHLGAIEDADALGRLLRAFAGSLGQGGGWSLLFAGEGAGRAHLRALAERLGVGARVHWMSPPREEERAGLLGSATLLAVAGEGPADAATAREALAAGLPVVAADAPRLGELVEPDGCGLLVDGGQLGAWSEALRLAASSPQRRRRWRKRARELAEERWSWSGVGVEFERVLLQAVERSVIEPSGDARPARQEG